MRRRRSQDEIRKILLNPAAAYKSPAAILADNELTKENKIEILRRWEYDACEVSVAGEEGMQASDGELLQQIVRAIGSLTGEINTKRTPPTKQGGLDRLSVKPKHSSRSGQKS